MRRRLIAFSSEPAASRIISQPTAERILNSAPQRTCSSTRRSSMLVHVLRRDASFVLRLRNKPASFRRPTDLTPPDFLELGSCRVLAELSSRFSYTMLVRGPVGDHVSADLRPSRAGAPTSAQRLSENSHPSLQPA